MLGFGKRTLARNRLIIGGLATLLLATVLAGGVSVAAQTETTSGESDADATAMTVWSATSPATHQGDQYELVVTNTGAAPQLVLVATLIMDHRAHENSFVLTEEVELAAGQARTFSARNDYGTANHFTTYVGTETDDVTLAVSLVDAAGTETARFSEKAFMTKDGNLDRMRRALERKEQRDADGSDRRDRRARHRQHAAEDESAVATPEL